MIKVGDTIQWVYKKNDQLVDRDRETYSITMKKLVPIGEPALVIEVTERSYTWLNSTGVYSNNFMADKYVKPVRVSLSEDRHQ